MSNAEILQNNNSRLNENNVDLASILNTINDLPNSAEGTADYNELENKPQVNGIELNGNKTLDELGIQTNKIDAHKKLKPSFAWIDDDGKEKVEHIYGWAIENNVPFTSAVITGWVKDKKKGWLTPERLQEMYKNSNGLMDIATHTQNHTKLSTVTPEAVEEEMINSIADLESWGLPCNSLVCPNGAITDEGIDVVRKYVPFCFAAGGTYDENNIPYGTRVNLPPIPTHRIPRADINGSYTEENGGISWLKEQIDNTIATDGLLVFMSHIGSTIASSDENGITYLDPSLDLAVYTEILNYIREKGYDIEPVTTVCERFANIIEVGNWTRQIPSDYFTVGANGKIQLDKGNMHVVVPLNTYNDNTLPSQYPQNQITTCVLNGNVGLPLSMTGTLTAYLVGNYGYRTFMPKIANILYTQIRASEEDKWLDWVEVNQNDYKKLANNKLTADVLPSAIPNGVSISLIANSTKLASLPEGETGYGIMTSYKLSTDSAYAREEWQPIKSPNKYVRYATSGSAWGDWYVFTATKYEG